MNSNDCRESEPGLGTLSMGPVPHSFIAPRMMRILVLGQIVLIFLMCYSIKPKGRMMQVKKLC